MIQSREQLFDGKIVRQRIDYWMNLFFKFDKGKYATRSKHLNHDWYLAQVEVCSNIIFKSARSHSQVAGASKTCPLFTGMPVDWSMMQ